MKLHFDTKKLTASKRDLAEDTTGEPMQPPKWLNACWRARLLFLPSPTVATPITLGTLPERSPNNRTSNHFQIVPGRTTRRYSDLLFQLVQKVRLGLLCTVGEIRIPVTGGQTQDFADRDTSICPIKAGAGRASPRAGGQ